MKRAGDTFSAGGAVSLGDLPLGARARVSSVSAGKNVRQRLFDLGFVPGTEVEAVRAAPLGDPRAYRIRGSVFALRKEDAQNILVEVQGEVADGFPELF